jgi:acyl CoA:acetate/3-ketoacid CoA transferase
MQPMRDKVVSASEAVAIIHPGDMIATSGFVGTPDAIFAALEQHFLETGEPRDLGLLFAAAQDMTRRGPSATLLEFPTPAASPRS